MKRSSNTRHAWLAVAGVATTLAVGALAVLMFAGFGGADGPPQKDMAIDAAARREVIESLSSALAQFYVYPDQAATIEHALQAQLAHGDFDRITSAAQFARTLSEAMQSLTHDRHLEVRYFADAIAVPVAGQEDAPEDEAAMLAERQRLNFGFETVARLPCDIGYIDLREFGRPAQVASRIEAAMTLVGDTRALIIDLRRMHGGDPETVMQVASYLFDRPTHLNDVYWRDENRIEARWTSATVTGRRYGESRPLVILTSARTFSAGEDFAYALKYAGRATLIGETTGGGAHPGNRRRLTAHFMMNVPTGRAINPVTKTDWEGVGVKPDIAVSAPHALDVAQVQLLKKLLAVETDPEWRVKTQERLHELQ